MINRSSKIGIAIFCCMVGFIGSLITLYSFFGQSNQESKISAVKAKILRVSSENYVELGIEFSAAGKVYKRRLSKDQVDYARDHINLPITIVFMRNSDFITFGEVMTRRVISDRITGIVLIGSALLAWRVGRKLISSNDSEYVSTVGFDS